jgi:hypothetical protein
MRRRRRAAADRHARVAAHEAQDVAGARGCAPAAHVEREAERAAVVIAALQHAAQRRGGRAGRGKEGRRGGREQREPAAHVHARDADRHGLQGNP